MNHIQQLAERAKKSVPHGLGVDKWIEVYNEKFAELIVEECVKVAHPKLTDVGEWAAGMRLVQQRLKQHFGVEE